MPDQSVVHRCFSSVLCNFLVRIQISDKLRLRIVWNCRRNWKPAQLSRYPFGQKYNEWSANECKWIHVCVSVWVRVFKVRVEVKNKKWKHWEFKTNQRRITYLLEETIAKSWPCRVDKLALNYTYTHTHTLTRTLTTLSACTCLLFQFESNENSLNLSRFKANTLFMRSQNPSYIWS